MLLKVGDLAKRCGLTVRTLHHYDAIKLLRPLARADNGYRLCNRSDIARLHQIQALRRFGLSLAEIGKLLAGPAKQLSPIVNQQIEALDRQVRQVERLRTRLARLAAQLERGEEPELTDWLVTLTVRKAMDGGARVEEPAVQALAKRWMQMLVRDTGDPRLFAKLNLMHFKETWLDLHRSFAGDDPQTHARFAAAHAAEPELLVGSFVTEEMLAYILPALAKLREE